MKILVTNWRDIENPNAGGAEVFTHQVLKRLAERGHEPTLFTSAFDGCDREEVIDGVTVVRSGGRFTVYRKAKKYYRRRFRGEFDVVVDEINTRPFMTPKYVDEPVVALIHQLAREIWFFETSFPVDRLGYHWLEDQWLRRYTDVPTLTISESTRKDLVDIDFQDVTVVPQGLGVEPVDEVPEKADVPTLLFVGRMNAAKRPDHALKAFEYIKRRFSDAELQMVGDGELLDDVRKRAGENVTIHGYVPEAEKQKLLKQSHALLVPSVREGWGLVVTEAAAMGTPAVGYHVPGLRDSIEDGTTGFLSASDPRSLATSAMSLFDDYDAYAKNALENARQYDWEATTDTVEQQLREVAR